MMVVRVLVTNDDGIDSPGLQPLAAVAVDLGLDVVVAAPHTERSGTSAALTVLEEDGRLAMQQRRMQGVPGDVLAIEATPAFIARVAADGAFGDPPHLVLSGINIGPNTGRSVLHSGTVGAALTASAQGIPGLAFSLDTANPTHFDTAAGVARQLLEWALADLDRLNGQTLSINVPDVAPADVRGLRSASLATVGATEGRVGERGEGFVTITFGPVDTPPEPGTDVALLAGGWATATLLRGPSEDGDVDLPRLR